MRGVRRTAYGKGKYEKGARRRAYGIRVATWALLLEISNEDYFTHRFANLLRVTHPQLIDAKLRVKGRHTERHKR